MGGSGGMEDTSVLGTDAFGCESSSLSYPTRVLTLKCI